MLKLNQIILVKRSYSRGVPYQSFCLLGGSMYYIDDYTQARLKHAEGRSGQISGIAKFHYLASQDT